MALIIRCSRFRSMSSFFFLSDGGFARLMSRSEPPRFCLKKKTFEIVA
jgi:hypothetical protein